MIREFYDLNGNLLTSCRCYVDASYCVALNNHKYKVEYNRPTNTEKIILKDTINAKEFKNLVKFLQSDLNVELDDTGLRIEKDNRCGAVAQFPYGDLSRGSTIYFYKGSKMFHACACTMSMNNHSGGLRGCAILADFDVHKIPYEVHNQDILRKEADVNILTSLINTKDMWAIDNFYLFGICAGCKWHKTMETGPYVFKREKCNICTVPREQCSAIKMINDGFTKYEAKVRCLACYQTLQLKRKLSK